MAAGPTYEPIVTTTLVSSTGSITFSSITGIYTDLILISNIKSNTNATASLLFEVNGSNSGSLYSGTMIFGTGATAGSNGTASLDYGTIMRNGGLSASNTVIQPFITHFMNYSNTTTFKTIISRNNVVDVLTGADIVLWRSTTAINQIRVMADTNGFAIGSTFSLYGIAAA
jgi:hypothetical protein